MRRGLKARRSCTSASRGAGEFHDVAGVGETFGGNICHREQFAKGNPDQAFADADEIVDETFEFPDDLSVRHGAA